MIQGQKISKCYRIYRHPSDRLKEFLSPRRKQFHEPFWAVRESISRLPVVAVSESSERMGQARARFSE